MFLYIRYLAAISDIVALHVETDMGPTPDYFPRGFPSECPFVQ